MPDPSRSDLRLYAALRQRLGRAGGDAGRGDPGAGRDRGRHKGAAARADGGGAGAVAGEPAWSWTRSGWRRRRSTRTWPAAGGAGGRCRWRTGGSCGRGLSGWSVGEGRSATVGRGGPVRLVRRGLPVRVAGRRVPGAPAGAAVAAPARRRLADLAGAGGPRVRQDPVRPPSGSAIGSRRCGPPDRPGGGHGGRRPRHDGRGPQRDPRRLPALGPAAVRAVQAPADLAQRGGGDDLLGRRAGPAARARNDCAWLDELAAFRYPTALDNLLFGLRLGEDPRLCVTTTPKPVRLVTELVSRPDDGDRPGDDLREPGPPGGVVLRADRHQVRGDPAGPAGAAGRDPRGLRRRLVPVGSTRPARDRGGRVLTRVPGAPGDRLRGLAARRRPSGSRCARCGTCRPWTLPDRGEVRVTPGGWVLPPAVPLVAEHGLRSVVTVFGDFHAEGLYSEAAARAILAQARRCPAAAGGPTRSGWTRRRRPGPGSARRPTRSSSGSSARVLARWPSHRVLDGLDQLEVLLDQGCLLLHPRCADAEGGVPELRPAPDAGRRLAGRAGRPAAPARGPDGRPAGRGPGPVPRGPDRAAAAADRPGRGGVSHQTRELKPMAAESSDGLGGPPGTRWRNLTGDTWYQLVGSLRQPGAACLRLSSPVLRMDDKKQTEIPVSRSQTRRLQGVVQSVERSARRAADTAANPPITSAEIGAKLRQDVSRAPCRARLRRS